MLRAYSLFILLLLVLGCGSPDKPTQSTKSTESRFCREAPDEYVVPSEILFSPVTVTSHTSAVASSPCSTKKSKVDRLRIGVEKENAIDVTRSFSVNVSHDIPAINCELKDITNSLFWDAESPDVLDIDLTPSKMGPMPGIINREKDVYSTPTIRKPLRSFTEVLSEYNIESEYNVDYGADLDLSDTKVAPMRGLENIECAEVLVPRKLEELFNIVADEEIVTVESEVNELEVLSESITDECTLVASEKKELNGNSKKSDGINWDEYDSEGYHIVTKLHWKSGRDRDGYDEEGYGSDGFHIYGSDRDGYNRDGYDVDGYDRDGFNEKGYDREGYYCTGYDNHGVNKFGICDDGTDLVGDVLSQLESLQFIMLEKNPRGGFVKQPVKIDEREWEDSSMEKSKDAYNKFIQEHFIDAQKDGSISFQRDHLAILLNKIRKADIPKKKKKPSKNEFDWLSLLNKSPEDDKPINNESKNKLAREIEGLFKKKLENYEKWYQSINRMIDLEDDENPFKGVYVQNFIRVSMFCMPLPKVTLAQNYDLLNNLLGGRMDRRLFD